MDTASLSNANAVPFGLEQTLPAEDVKRLAAHPLGATIRREAPSVKAETTLPDVVVPAGDPIAALPHITVAPEGALGASLPDASADAAQGGAEFHVLRVLGRGGMGQVHLAEQRSLRREVAIKSVLVERADDNARRLLLHEASVTGALEHPNIIPVHLLGRDDHGAPLIVMKKVEGVAWADLIEKADHPWWAKLLREAQDRVDFHLDVLRQVCHALEFAHQAGVIHRDLKPGNVMLGAFGEVYLLDWGLAARLDDHGRVSDAMSMIGTPGFMAPELVTSMAGPQGVWTDVYLLGSTLHNALTGRYRHEGATLEGALRASLLDTSVTYPPTVPEDLAALCNRATRLHPDDRPASAREFRLALEECVAHRGSMALQRAARASLASLRAALHPADGGRVDRDAAVRASGACRFGFTQSLAAWPQNEYARAGLQECLDLLFDDELARDNLEGAESVASEMPRRTPEHDARIQGLREKREAEARRVASLQSAAFEMDKSVSLVQRSRSFLAWGVFILGFNLVSAFRLWRGGEPDHAELVGLGVAGLAAATFFVWRERRSLLRNAYNRAVSASVLTLMSATLLHRVAAAARHVPVAWVATGDLMIVACICGLSAMILVRWFAGAAVVCAVAAALAVAFPAHAFALFVAASTLSLTLSMGIAWKEGVFDPTRKAQPE